MIYALVILVIVAALAYAGTLLSQYPGYVEVGFASGSFQMPLWYFILAMIVAIALAMVSFKIIWTAIRLPTIAKRFGKNRRAHKASDLLQKGMLAMGKGQWKRAESTLAKGARLSYESKQDPGLFLSAAAQAAQHQGASDRRDQYLLEARQLAAEGVDTLSAAMAEAQLHLESNEPEQALSVLKPHHTLHYNNKRLLSLESEAYEQLGQHGEVWRLLKMLKKEYANKTAYQARQAEVARNLFSTTNSTLDSIETVWSELPKVDKKDDNVLLAYVSALINHDQDDKAESVLAKEIRATYSDPLIHAYTQLEVGSSRTRLDKLANWVRARPDNAYLNYGAAKLAFQSEQLDKAKDYAEHSVKSQALPEALALLGKIYEALGEQSHAMQAYRTSLGLTYVDQTPVVQGEVLPSPDNKALTSDSTMGGNVATHSDSVVADSNPA